MDIVINQINQCISSSADANRLIHFVNSTMEGIQINKLIVIHGNGCNGRSTFQKYFFELLNNDATIISSDVITMTRNSPTSVVNINIMNKKLICFSETIDTAIRAGQLKEFLLRNKIYIKPLYKEPMEIISIANYLLILNTDQLNVLQNIDARLYDLICFDKTF